MPRPLVYGNGSLFVGCDEHHRIRELTWPHIGWPNHLSGRTITWGIWSQGRLLWSHDPGWRFRFEYQGGRGVVFADFHDSLSLRITEWIEPEAARFHRQFEVVTAPDERVRLFVSHRPQLWESDIADTALYLPEIEAIAHYKGACWIGFGFDRPMSQYACGMTDFGGHEGTWRDAEDDHLSMNPIAQGSVDSVASVELDLAGGDNRVRWQIACAESEAELVKACRGEAQPPTLADDWSGLPDDWAKIAATSLDLVHAHCDREGAIIAACDSHIMQTNRAHYAFCWPRDGALTGLTLLECGDTETPRRFLQFCERALPESPALWHQKYRPDGTEGASWHPRVIEGERTLPVQLDESALTLILAAKFDGEFSAMKQRVADALADHWQMPCWDLWEERRGVHFFTLCTILRAFRDLGRPEAEEVAGFVSEQMVGEDGAYLRTLGQEPTADASALLGLLLAPELLTTEAAQNTITKVSERLWSRGIGGICRYEHDWYFRQPESPPNPWIICTLWLARIQLLRGDRGDAERLIQWCVDRAETSGVLAEQVHWRTGDPLSVSPLTWSHAELLETLMAWRG